MVTDTGPALAANEATAAPQGTIAANQRALAAVPMPGPVDAPTQRPNEPVQAGLPMGPGPLAQPLPSRDDKTMARLDGLVRTSQDPQLAILVGRLKAQRLR